GADAAAPGALVATAAAGAGAGAVGVVAQPASSPPATSAPPETTPRPTTARRLSRRVPIPECPSFRPISLTFQLFAAIPARCESIRTGIVRQAVYDGHSRRIY